MENMDFDKLVEDHLSKKYPHPISDNDVYFENGFRAGANWAKDLLSSQVKEDHISPEDRRMIYDMSVKIMIAYVKCGFKTTTKEAYETAKRLYLLIKQES
jgi:hypothetical protein